MNPQPVRPELDCRSSLTALNENYEKYLNSLPQKQKEYHHLVMAARKNANYPLHKLSAPLLLARQQRTLIEDQYLRQRAQLWSQRPNDYFAAQQKSLPAPPTPYPTQKSAPVTSSHHPLPAFGQSMVNRTTNTTPVVQQTVNSFQPRVSCCPTPSVVQQSVIQRTNQLMAYNQQMNHQVNRQANQAVHHQAHIQAQAHVQAQASFNGNLQKVQQHQQHHQAHTIHNQAQISCCPQPTSQNRAQNYSIDGNSFQKLIVQNHSQGVGVQCPHCPPVCSQRVPQMSRDFSQKQINSPPNVSKIRGSSPPTTAQPLIYLKPF